jgi:hypothetical protein
MKWSFSFVNSSLSEESHSFSFEIVFLFDKCLLFSDSVIFYFLWFVLSCC